MAKLNSSGSKRASRTRLVKIPAIDISAWSLSSPFKLLKAVKRRPGYTEKQIDDEAVLIRAYGKGTDVLIDRERMALPTTKWPVGSS